MIKKEMITIRSTSWYDVGQTHRYVLKKQWYKGTKEEQTENLAVVVTIRPTGTTPFVEDLSSLLIEKNVRQLGFTGFIAVNLFSSIKAKKKATFVTGADENTFEVISTVLNDKGVKEIIFACGSILTTNSLALKQAKTIYDLLTVKQKKMTKMLINPTNGTFAHPLNVYSRKEWVLNELDPAMFQLEGETKTVNDKAAENGNAKRGGRRAGNVQKKAIE